MKWTEAQGTVTNALPWSLPPCFSLRSHYFVLCLAPLKASDLHSLIHTLALPKSCLSTWGTVSLHFIFLSHSASCFDLILFFLSFSDFVLFSSTHSCLLFSLSVLSLILLHCLRPHCLSFFFFILKSVCDQRRSLRFVFLASLHSRVPVSSCTAVLQMQEDYRDYSDDRHQIIALWEPHCLEGNLLTGGCGQPGCVR